MEGRVEITVYSKEGCGKCEAAKDKLEKMGFEYDVKDLEQAIEVHDGWREDDTYAVMVAHIMMDTLPIISIKYEGMEPQYHDYSSAMKELKGRKNGSKSKTQTRRDE